MINDTRRRQTDRTQNVGHFIGQLACFFNKSVAWKKYVKGREKCSGFKNLKTITTKYEMLGSCQI